MRRVAKLIPVLGALLLAPLLLASSSSDKWLVEDGTSGSSSSATLIGGGQGATTLVPHTCAANLCTRAQPTTSSSPDEGLDIGGVKSYRVEAALSSGNFLGTGAIELWLKCSDPATATSAVWLYVSGGDITPPAGAGKTPWSTLVKGNDFRAPGCRLVARSNGVGTSAAAPTMTVSIRACNSFLGCGN